MARKPKSVAFIGTGATTEANVTALLDDWLPEEDSDGEIDYNPPIIPDKIRRADKGLNKCWDWVHKAFGEDIERFRSMRCWPS